MKIDIPEKYTAKYRRRTPASLAFRLSGGIGDKLLNPLFSQLLHKRAAKKKHGRRCNVPARRRALRA